MQFPENVRTREVPPKALVGDYLEAARASQTKTATAIERRLGVVAGILGNVPAKNVKAEDLERLKIELATGTRTERRKHATIDRHLQDLKAFFCSAVDGGRLDRNPFNGVALLTENNKRSHDLTPEEEFRLFATLPDNPQAPRPHFRFLLATGARPGDACALTWRAISEADAVAALPETKAGQKQYLALSTEALRILRDLPRVAPPGFLLAGRPFTVDFTRIPFTGPPWRLAFPIFASMTWGFCHSTLTR